MQFTVIAVQKNGRQMMLGRELHEHMVENLIHDAVLDSDSDAVIDGAKYRSFIAVGTTANATQVVRYNGRGEVASRQVGLV